MRPVPRPLPRLGNSAARGWAPMGWESGSCWGRSQVAADPHSSPKGSATPASWGHKKAGPPSPPSPPLDSRPSLLTPRTLGQGAGLSPAPPHPQDVLKYTFSFLQLERGGSRPQNRARRRRPQPQAARDARFPETHLETTRSPILHTRLRGVKAGLGAATSWPCNYRGSRGARRALPQRGGPPAACAAMAPAGRMPTGSRSSGAPVANTDSSEHPTERALVWSRVPSRDVAGCSQPRAPPGRPLPRGPQAPPTSRSPSPVSPPAGQDSRGSQDRPQDRLPPASCLGKPATPGHWGWTWGWGLLRACGPFPP